MRLDAEGERFVTQIRWGAYESTVFVVDAAGDVHGKRDLRKRVPGVGVVDVIGGDGQEIVVELIEGDEMSSYPTAWRFYRVTARGKLVLLATVAESNGYGAKCIRYFFRNEITIPEKGIIRVENVYFDEQGPDPPPKSPRAPGESYELRWNAKERRLERKRLPARETDSGERGCDSPNGETRWSCDAGGIGRGRTLRPPEPDEFGGFE